MNKLSTKNFWKKIWQLTAVAHGQIKVLVVLSLFEESTALIGPYILKLIIDALTGFSVESISYILLLVGLMFLANQVRSIFGHFKDRKIFKILMNIEVSMLNNAHQKMMELSLNYHAKENTGNKIIKIQKGSERIRHLLSSVFWEVLPTTFQLIFTTIVLFVIDWRFGTVLLIFAPLFILITLKANKKASPLRRKRFDIEEEASGLMAQSIININTVKSFVQENRERLQFKKGIGHAAKIFIKEFRTIINYSFLRILIIDISRVLIIFLGAYFVWQGEITIGTLVFVFTISEKALISLFRISRLYDQIMESSEAVERLYQLSQEESDIKNPKGGLKPPAIKGAIEFKSVQYRYEESNIRALNGVSTQIPTDSVTALIGPSGGGKTTFARMIYRHYDPQNGKVLLDNHDLREYDLFAFRKFIAIVPQEVEIFNTSVRDNIAYAKLKATFEEVKAAAHVANAEEFIKQLKNGYKTMVGERGVKLSGGQRQRIGIARALLANPRILVFDEATSNLDSHSEKLIQDAIDKISKNRTMIIIAHRLSTIKKADKIIVLEKGKIVEEGSHTELSRNDGGLYKKLLSLQKMGDVE